MEKRPTKTYELKKRCGAFRSILFINSFDSVLFVLPSRLNLGKVVLRPISANRGLNFNRDICFFISEVFSRIIFCILLTAFRASNIKL